MLLDLVILSVCSVAIATLSLLILLRNPAQKNNRRFAYLSTSLVIWSIANFLSDHATSHVLLFTRLTFVGGVASVYTLMLFMVGFPNQSEYEHGVYFRVQMLYALLLVPLIFFHEFIKSVSLSGGGIDTGYLYSLFVAYVGYSLVLFPFIIRQQIRRVPSAAQKQQAIIVVWGIILYAIFAVVSSVVLPSVVGNWSSSRFGPAFTLFLVGTVAYAVIRHRLFDIRLIVARSAAYTLTLLVTVLLYGFIAFGIVARLFFKGQLIGIDQQVVFSILTVILVFTFPAIQKFFNRTTNHLFYRDAYDSEVFLDEFNKILVSTFELEPLLLASAELIQLNLKSSYCTFIIKGTEGEGHHVVSAGKRSIVDDAELEFLQHVSAATKKDVIFSDTLQAGHAQYQKMLHQKEVDVVVRLSSRGKNHELVGYLILGGKKSGNLYTPQDINIIEILANELVIAVQNALRTEEIRLFNETLQGQVREATKRLRHSNIRLKALDETKDDFISMASHQLRTPLTSVKGYLSMVLDGDAGPLNDTQKKLLEQSYRSSQQMVYLISDLLNLSRLNTGKFVIEPSEVDLSELAQFEVGQLAETARARNITLIYDKPTRFPHLQLDETKTHQVVMNFIDNAIYYTKAGGSVTVTLKETPQYVEFRVTDTGIGVPKAVQHKLFSKFYRAENAQKARPDGTGLGLFMAKKVIAAQGGAIIFESEEGKGSTFGFRFNKSRHMAAAQASGKLEKLRH